MDPSTRPWPRSTSPTPSAPCPPPIPRRSTRRRFASARCSVGSCAPADEPGEQRHEPVREVRDLAGRRGGDVAAEGGDLDRGGGLDGFRAGDGERAGLVRAGYAASALGAVETGGLRGAVGLVAELGVADPAREDRDEELTRDGVRDEAVVGK